MTDCSLDDIDRRFAAGEGEQLIDFIQSLLDSASVQHDNELWSELVSRLTVALVMADRLTDARFALESATIKAPCCWRVHQWLATLLWRQFEDAEAAYSILESFRSRITSREDLIASANLIANIDISQGRYAIALHHMNVIADILPTFMPSTSHLYDVELMVSLIEAGHMSPALSFILSRVDDKYIFASVSKSRLRKARKRLGAVFP